MRIRCIILSRFEYHSKLHHFLQGEKYLTSSIFLTKKNMDQELMVLMLLWMFLYYICCHVAQISLHGSQPSCVAVALQFFPPRLVICIMSHKHFWFYSIMTPVIFLQSETINQENNGPIFPVIIITSDRALSPQRKNKWWLAVTKRSCWRQCWDVAKRAKNAGRCTARRESE